MRLPGRKSTKSGAVGRSVSYSSSPLLASKTPPWRSKFLVALVGVGSLVLLGRAVHIQILGNQFYRDQGEKRYAYQLELLGIRGRITDRHGALLATSVAVPSVWAIPKDVQASLAQKHQLARLLGVPSAEIEKKLADPNARFAWLKRQVEEPVWQQVQALGIKGIYQTREHRRKYPEGEAAAHLVGFTDVEDRGQEGIELAFQKELQGRDGSRMVVKDRLGRVVEDIGNQVDPSNGQPIELAVDAKVQFFAYQRVRDAVAEHKAKAGSVVVLDIQTGEVLALANYPSFDPAERRNLNGAQLRNRALTDTFEPGSTMKPFIAAWALETGRVTPTTPIQTAPGFISITGSTIRDAHPHGVLSVAEVIQKS
ncbi:MAG: penicillin-binding protein 2, partial [Burkholderiaceae bacterium]